MRITGAEVDLVHGQVRRAEGAVALTTREVELLSYLADRAGQAISRDELHEQVWGYSPQVHSRAVDFTVHRLRAKLEVDPANPRHLQKVHGVGYRLVLPDEAEAALPDGRATVVAGHLDRRSLRWHADPQATARDMRALRDRVESLAGHHGATLSRTVPPLLVFSEPAGALAAARQLATEDDLGVGLATDAVTWWIRGDAAEADGPAVARAEVLARSWEPGHVISDEATAAALPEEPWRDLGPRHLHELGRNVRAFDLSVRQATAASAPGTNVRAHAEPLVGRLAQIDDVLQRLQERAVVTLWGPGGAGKTRLGREVALRWVEQGRQAWLCSLPSTGDAAEIGIAIGDAAGLPRTPTRQRAGLRARGRVLLVLDRADAMPETVAKVVAELAAAAPQARFLVTSRSRPPAGDVVEVGPLSPEEAAELLSERAHRRNPSFGHDEVTVRRLVARVGCLPLSLELVGAAAALRSPAQLLKAVEGGALDADVAAIVAWSFGLLDADVAALLTRLAVFPASFTLDAAEAVVGTEGVDTTEALAQLRDHALLYDVGDPDSVRVALYDEVRAFARSRLEASGGWSAGVARHAAWTLARGEEHLKGLSTLGEAEAMRAIGGDLPDILCVEQRARATGDLATQSRAVQVAAAVLLRTGPQSLLEQLIAPLVPTAESRDGALGVLATASGVARRLGRRAEALALAQRRLKVAHRLGDPAEIVFAEAQLAHLEPSMDQIDQREAWVEALVDAGRPDRAASVCNHLLLDVGRLDPDREERWVARGLELARQAGHQSMEAMLLLNHGTQIAEEDDRAREGASLILRGARIDRALGNPWGASASLANAGYTLVLAGEVAEGVGLLEGARAEAAALGNVALASLILGQLADVALIEGRLDDARVHMEACLDEGRGIWTRDQADMIATLHAALRWRLGEGAPALADLDRALHRLSKLRAVRQWRGVQACLLAADGRTAEALAVLPEVGDDPRYVGLLTLTHQLTHALVSGDSRARAAAGAALAAAPRRWHELRLAAYVGHLL